MQVDDFILKIISDLGSCSQLYTKLKINESSLIPENQLFSF